MKISRDGTICCCFAQGAKVSTATTLPVLALVSSGIQQGTVLFVVAMPKEPR